jgi:hypothetical protein
MHGMATAIALSHLAQIDSREAASRAAPRRAKQARGPLAGLESDAARAASAYDPCVLLMAASVWDIFTAIASCFVGVAVAIAAIQLTRLQRHRTDFEGYVFEARQAERSVELARLEPSGCWPNS